MLISFRRVVYISYMYNTYMRNGWYTKRTMANIVVDIKRFPLSWLLFLLFLSYHFSFVRWYVCGDVCCYSPPKKFLFYFIFFGSRQRLFTAIPLPTILSFFFSVEFSTMLARISLLFDGALTLPSRSSDRCHPADIVQCYMCTDEYKLPSELGCNA